MHRPAPEIGSVAGTKPKAPRLTRDAKWALEKLQEHLEAIKSQLGSLTETSLRGLAFEALRSVMWEDEALWRGIAEDAKRRQTIRAAHRTGRGKWLAVFELARAHGTLPYAWEQITVAHAKGRTLEEAVEAGRLLMAEKAEWVGPDVEIIVDVRSALEWRP